MNNLKPFLYLIILLFFNNCGYTPVYSNKNNEDLIAISVKNIKDRSGQILRNSLLNQLNPEKERVIIKYKKDPSKTPATPPIIHKVTASIIN